MCFFFNDTATTEIYTYGHTLSLHDALPICSAVQLAARIEPHVRPGEIWATEAFRMRLEAGPTLYAAIEIPPAATERAEKPGGTERSEEHTSELQSLMRISYAVFCLTKKNRHKTQLRYHNTDVQK